MVFQSKGDKTVGKKDGISRKIWYTGINPETKRLILLELLNNRCCIETLNVATFSYVLDGLLNNRCCIETT